MEAATPSRPSASAQAQVLGSAVSSVRAESTAKDAAERAARDIEWHSLLESIAGRCAGDTAAERILALKPYPSRAAAAARAALVREAAESLAGGDPIDARPVAPLNSCFERIERGASAGGEELRDIERMLRGATQLRAHARQCAHTLPLLAQALHSDSSLNPIQSSIAKAIDESGRVMDDASPALRAASNSVRSTRNELVKQLKRLVSSYGDVLQDARYVERDGRYGLPVRADAHRRVKGIVLGASATGATLYVEPPESTALGNKLALAEATVERERARVLQQLSASVQRQLEQAEEAYEACLVADELAALTRWASEQRARLIEPNEEHLLRLCAMRHPLLAEQGIEVVPHDIELSAGRALVVSGPNAGGKTVALKSLGLAALMVASAIPLPAAKGTRVGFFPRVFTDVGDQQSIAQSLSTFSGHITNLRDIVAGADGGTLVLLDEVAGGTDPEEGAALAIAVVEALLERGAAVVATTHYERLKEAAAADERMDNASVGFDFDKMMPTFALKQGVPGPSSALAVAARFGLPAAVVERARVLVGDDARRREDLLAELERERIALAAANQAAAEHQREAEQLLAQVKSEREIAREKERKRLADASAALMSDVRSAREQLRTLAAQLPDKKTLRSAERAVDKAARLAAIGGPLEKATQKQHNAKPTQQLTVGSRVFVPRLRSDAKIISLHGKEARVQAGAFSLLIPIAELGAPKKGGTKAPKPVKLTPVKTYEEPKQEIALRTEDNTCDLRGMRVDEALDAVDQFIDAQLRAREPASFILHGHGSGALKQAVRSHLKGHPVLSWVRPAAQREGGDAFTVFATA